MADVMKLLQVLSFPSSGLHRKLQCTVHSQSSRMFGHMEYFS